MISARSVFLYLCVSLAALAASAPSASAATSGSSSPFSTEPFSVSRSEFLSCHSFNLAGQPAAHAINAVASNACAGRILRVSPASRAANTSQEFQNTQENAGSTAINVCSGERNDRRGTGSL